LALSTVSCDPIEAISDTFTEIGEEISPKGNDDNLVVWQVLAQITFTSPGNASVAVKVLSKAGSAIKDDTEVKCVFTEPSSGGFFEFNASRV
jgi:hypothetical protein|tara:strand:+ start:97 stop:372 length:276 start_codon:yes stop_codon:yes gene_type:complete